MDSFDKSIINRLNPSYYGRYVDDIIIVDKVESNISICELLLKGSTKLEEVINLVLCQYFGHKKSNFFMLHF